MENLSKKKGKKIKQKHQKYWNAKTRFQLWKYFPFSNVYFYVGIYAMLIAFYLIKCTFKFIDCIILIKKSSFLVLCSISSFLNKVSAKSAFSPVPLLGEIKYMVYDVRPIKSAFP